MQRFSHIVIQHAQRIKR